jgi:hypothetical protein
MKNIERALVEVKEEGPQLHVVTAAKAVGKVMPPSPPLTLTSPLHSRRPRPELAVLGWSTRATRLVVMK